MTDPKFNAHELPIHAALPRLYGALNRCNRVVLEAPPGAGKTTAVPLALLKQSWLGNQKILMLEPRRIAARSAAHYMAQQLCEAVGQTVGYRIRFEAKVSAATRIEVLTEGILARMLQDDPELAGVGLVIFDEFHERHLHSDLALALSMDMQSVLRPDLRILLMSATLDGERLTQWLSQDGACENVRSEGRAYPVSIRYLPPPREEPIAHSLLRALRAVLPESEGDVLVFLPGRAEIMQCERAVLSLIDEFANLSAVALHGELTIEQQTSALAPARNGERKIVLATNVAESSLTLPGVRVVIDSGLAREPKFDANRGFASLTDVWISQASATQRAGRAGRVAPGIAVRLYASSRRLDLQVRPEITRADLAPLALALYGWGVGTGEFLQRNFLDAPPPGSYQQSLELLQTLGALAPKEQNTVGALNPEQRAGTDAEAVLKMTAHGKAMLATGAHPRLANLVIRAPTQSKALACDVLALIEARDPLKGPERFSEAFASRWNTLAAWRARRQHGGDHSALSAIDQAARQWRKRLNVRDEPPLQTEPHRLGELLLHAFIDRVAKVRSDAAMRFTRSDGGGAILSHDSPMLGEPWLVISELDGTGADARIRKAAPVRLDELAKLYPARFINERVQRFDADTRGVLAKEIERFDAIILSERSVPAKNATAQLLLGIRQLGISALPWSDSLLNTRARINYLRAWMPELNLPDASDTGLLNNLEDWLAPFLESITKLSQLQNDALNNALRSQLSYAQQQSLEQHAPDRLIVPSGIERQIIYPPEGPPILAVKLQELFGLSETPTIAAGRVRVMLHLLSPGGKPVQVTQDLKNFWNTTYAEVKKEMKGRYPRHPWPDDPWTATATHRAKPRGT